MSKSLTARLVGTLTGTYGKTNTFGGDQSIAIPSDLNFNTAFSDGSGANQVNRYASKQGTTTDTPAVALDLNGTSSDQFGDTTDMTKVRAVVIKNTHATNNLVVGGQSTDIAIFTTAVTLLPGETLIRHIPTSTAAAVSAGVRDKINVAAETGLTGSYSMMVLGSA